MKLVSFRFPPVVTLDQSRMTLTGRLELLELIELSSINEVRFVYRFPPVVTLDQ